MISKSIVRGSPVRLMTAAAVTLFLVIALCMTATSPAHAADGTAWAGPTVSVAVERDVQALLKLNPHSHRVASNAVEVQRGAVIEVGVPEQAEPASAWLECEYKFLCMFNYAHEHWDPNATCLGCAFRLALTDCGLYNVGDILMPDLRPWNDKITSVVNNQTWATQSRFYDYGGSGDWRDTRNDVQLASLDAPGHWDDLQHGPHAHDDSSIDNRIDIVHVC